MSHNQNDDLPSMYKKLIENELSKTEEEKSAREKWMKENHEPKKYLKLELMETPDNIIKIMTLLKEIVRNEKT